MHGGFQTFRPVITTPLPYSVRSEMHTLIRRGFTIISTDLVVGQWNIRYRDGSRDLRLTVVDEKLADLGGDAA